MNEPIVITTVFKGGTWLVRKIVEDLTGLSLFEPPPAMDIVDYQSTHGLEVHPGKYYCWHLVLTPDVQARLREIDAKVVIITRNIYDLVVSMYYHFANDTDKEIGRGTRQSGYFAEIGKEKALEIMIRGCKGEQYTWPGIGWHLRQLELSLAFAVSYPCCVLPYEQIVNSRRSAVRKLASYLNVSVDNDRLMEIVDASRMDRMKKERPSKSHYRKGKPYAHDDDLTWDHILMVRREMKNWAKGLEKLAIQAGLFSVLRCSVRRE